MDSAITGAHPMTMPGPHAVLAGEINGEPGGVVILLTDMGALPVDERRDFP